MEALCGVSTWEEYAGGGNGRCLGRRGHSEAIFALAMPAWHRTVIYRLDGKLRSPKYAITPYFNGPYRPNCTVPSDRTSTSLIIIYLWFWPTLVIISLSPLRCSASRTVGAAQATLYKGLVRLDKIAKDRLPLHSADGFGAGTIQHIANRLL